ncbi:microtubule-actin cross-linking factor 1 isoform X35 [Oryctolagus cuniculus]|uniref:microtubule-actin cross-linking factor 1 isoform X35 n=1 Tax=Oryctolagus cuniculus TaxID=9986 RepID=UPI00387A6FB7
MGNSLGCVKEPKESIAIPAKAPISPKKRVRFKRKWRGKKIPTPEASHQEEPLEGTGVTEETETLTKLTVSLQKEDGVGGAELPPSDILLPGDSASNSGAGDQGMIVQVKERFQGEVQTAHLLLENESSVAGGVWDSLEEGMTVIARLLDNPAERNCEKSVSQLVQFPRTASCSSRAVLLPLQGEAAVEKGNPQLGFRSSAVPRTDYHSNAGSRDQLPEGQRAGGGTKSNSDASHTASWTAECSVPSSLLDQSGGHRQTELVHVGQEPNQGLRLSASQSDLSVSGMTVSILPSSSGYGSDGPHVHGTQLKDTEPEKSSTSFSEEDGTLSLEANHTPSWGLEEISDIYISGESGDMSAKEKLLLWTQKVTAGYTGIKCTNFSSCWSDGKMFNALIHRYRPDLVDMERVQIQSNRENLEQAFEVAERLGVTRLLDAEDVDVPSPDEKSVITYVSSIYDAFPKVPEGGEGISATEVDSRWQEYQSRVDSLIPWIKQHTILMSDKSFPQNPVELKALYNQYIHFKETEILAKEREKGRIEELYKLLEVWIEFGRIKLPQGYHPNDVEEEWGKLIIEMLEREKSLRPAVERLELLLQIANKIQNGALNCEEKLTLAKNTLQADAAHLESGQPVQCESDVIMYIQECEGLIRQLQVDLQILRDENYYQLEELAFRVMRLQDELVTLRLECTNLYQKGHFTSLELVPPSTLTTTHLKAEPLTKTTHSSSTSWFRKPMTRAELVSISSSEDEGNLRFVYELLSWVEEMQMKLERAEWGNDLPSVELQLETQQHIHTSVEELGSSVKEARLYEGKMSQNFHTSYVETLGKLETQYCKLKETSSFRMRHLQSLHKFVSRATAELIWLNEKEEEELAYDWSDNNPNISAKKNYFSELMMELEEKQDVFRSLQDTAELLSLENHPAKQTVEAYSAAVQSQLQWMKQLCLCVEQHVKENTAYFQFFSDARDLESFLRNLQDSIKRKYSCDHNTSLSRLEDLLQDSMDEKEQLIQSKSSVASLVGRSKTIVQLKPRSPDHVLKSTISVKAICDYRQIEITICKNDECVLEDNSQRTKWKVISPTGNEAMVPSVCFLIPPPNKDAIEMASRVEQSYQKVMALWHQLHVNTKSLISWNYLRKDLDLVQTWNLEKLRSSAPGECHQVMQNLQAHYEDFLQDSRDSVLFSVADRLRLEEEVEACKAHFQRLVKSMENEDKEETVAKMYISELKNIQLRLEECEQRLVKRIQSPASSRTDKDARQESALRIAEQEHTQEDLQQLRSDLDAFSVKCNSFLHQSPSGSSVPTLRSELNLLVEKMDHVYGLSTVYLNKLKTIDVIMRSMQDAELLVKGYEIKLSQEEAVPADLSALESHRSTLRHWLSDVKDKNSVFSVLDEEISKAKVVAEQLNRLTPERNLDLERYQEKGSQLQERWHRVIAQLETRQSELESIQEVLGDYRACHGTLIKWIEETTAQQEMMKPGQAEDSRVLSEQLSQQTDLFAEIERNQTKLDQCQKFSQQYSTIVKDYELQLMTYKAFVESQQKSPGKRRRMLSSSDAITQEFMDLRTRYTALVTLTTQHVKYISDALRRLEEEEKVVEEEKQEHVEKVKELLGWVSTLARNTQGKATSSQTKESTDIEKAILEQQVLSEELTTKREQVSEAIKTSQIFLAKHGHKLSEKEKEQISEQLSGLNKAYHDLCDGSANQLQQLQSQLAQQTEQKGCRAVAGVIDLGTVEIFPIFRAMQKGLIDQDTGLVLLESQVITSGLIAPETSEKLSLEEGLARNLINSQMYQQLQELQDTLFLIHRFTKSQGPLSVVEAIEKRIISEKVGLKILEAYLAAGGFSLSPGENCINLEEAFHQGFISAWLHSVLESHLRSSKNLIDPNTAEKIGLLDLMQRCIVHQESGLKLLPVKQLAGGMVSLKSGRKVSIFRAVQEGLIDRQVTVRLLEAQLFAGGIVDPRTGHRLTVHEAVRHNLIDQDMACAILIRQLQTGGIIDTVTGQRLTVDEAVSNDLVAAKIALVILESLWSFMGLLWPESGEILPITDALEQGIVSTDLAHQILSNRQHIKALFLPATTEICSWEKAIENGILDKDLANNLKSVCIPDVMPHMQLADSSEQNNLSINSGAAALPCNKDQTEGVANQREKLLFQLMTHSYINVRNGQRLLLLDKELMQTLASRDEAQTSAPAVSGTGPQGLRTPEEFQESANVKITETFSDGLTVRHDEFQFSSQNEEYSDQKAHTEVKGKKAAGEIACPSVENPEKDLFVGEERVRNPAVGTLEVLSQVKSELQKQLIGVKKQSHTEMSTRDIVSKGLLTVPPEETESVPSVVDEDLLSIETPKEEWQALRKISFTCQKELANPLEIKCIPDETGEPLIKPQSKKSQFQVEKTLGLKSEPKSEKDMNIHCPDKQKVLNKTSLSRDDHKQSQEEANISDTCIKVLEKTNEEDDGIETSQSCSHPSELPEEATLNLLSAQLKKGGIFHEQTGEKLLLNEAVAQGIMPSHTAVKLMGKLNMFRGFFDSQTFESLTTEEVIDEGLMDEKLLHKVLMADKAVSGVLDPRTHTLCSVKDAVAVGLLDKETATRILEGQVVTGGIVDLKRGKKVSVTLASNLGLVDSVDQTELIKLEKAVKGRDAGKTVRERLISLQMETTGLMDPDRKAPLTVVESMDRGLLDREEALHLLTKQVVDGGIIHHTSGMRLSVDNAFQRGLISEDLAKQLKKVENLNVHQFFHPETKETISLPEAIELGLVNPDLKREIQEVQAFTENFVDLISSQRLTLAEAKKEGLLTNKAVVSSGMVHGIVDPESYRIVPYSELVKKCKIDIESGQRYLEVIPFSDIKDEVSDKVLTLSEAIQLGKVDFESTLKVLEAQANTGGIIDTATGKRLTLASALEQKLVDENMARIIASHQVLNGGIVDIFSDQRVTLEEAIEKRFISPELATMIKIDTLESSDHRVQFEKQDGTKVCELKDEFPRKEVVVACNENAQMSCDKGENKRLFQVKNESAPEKFKVKVSHGKQVKMSREISLKELEHKDQDPHRTPPDARESVSTITLSDPKREPLGQVSVTHPHSKVRDFKFKEGARHNKEKNRNEDQEIMTQIEIITHLKPSAPRLDSEDVRENQREMLSGIQESDPEMSGKLLSEQPVNTSVRSMREKKMIVEESVKICKPAVLSEEELNQEIAIGDEPDSAIKSQPVEMTASEKGKETIREKGFSVVCKIENSSSQLIPKNISVQNQDSLTFFGSEQVNVGELKNVSPYLTLKPEANLSQEITSGVSRELFSSVIPRPEELHYQDSVGKTQFTDTSQISKVDKTSQATTGLQPNYYQDSCVTSKTKETKDLIFSSNEYEEKSYQEVPFNSTRPSELEEIIVYKVNPKESSYLDLDGKGLYHQGCKGNYELATTQEIAREKFPEAANPLVTGSKAESLEGTVTQRGPTVLVTILPEKLPKDVSQKESTRQQDILFSPTTPETSEERPMTLASYSVKKMDEKTPQEKLRQSPVIEQTSFTTAPLGKGNEGANLEPFRATQVSFRNVFNRRLCLEHDEMLVSYLSLLRNIEMRTRQIQPLELDLAKLQDLLCQAEVLDRELKDLSTLVSQELECVNQIIISQPQEVPAQLLKALEKDAKNLQKSLSSVSDTWSSRLLHLQNAMEVKKTAVLSQHAQLEDKLQDLRAWVGSTSLTLSSKGCSNKTDPDSLNHSLQQFEDLKQPMAERKSQLDALAFDIQFFVSKHAQDLSPQQSRQTLRLLNEVQKSFQDLVEQTAAQVDALQGRLQQVEQEAQVKTLQKQQNTCHQKLEDLCRWIGQAERALEGQQDRGTQQDLSALQKNKSDLKDLQDDIQNHATSFSTVVKDIEGFLEENQTKLSPQELTALQQKLSQAKEQYEALQEQTRVAQKELEEAVTSALQQETEKSKAAKELAENRNKIDALLDWVTSVESSCGRLQTSLPGMEQLPGADPEKRTLDTTDGHMVVSHAPENLDRQCAKMKACHQELLSQQQNFILATQSAQAFLDQHGHNLEPKERQMLQEKLGELKEQYATSLAQSEADLKQVQTLRDELQKFLQDHKEFESWLERSEKELENMHKGSSSPEALPSLLKRQGSFSEDVISHKGDLRFVTISGQKVLDTENNSEEGKEPSATRHLVKEKLKDATERYTALHSKCARLGSHLNMLLSQYQQFQSSADSLQAWMQTCEANVEKLLSDTVASDPGILQQQLLTTKQLQEELAEHQVPVEKLQKIARDLMEIEGEPAPDHTHVQETTDSILSHFHRLSCSLAERSALLQKAIAQSQSVQESLESLLQSIREVEQNLEGKQVASLSTEVIQEALATNTKLKQDIARQKSSLEATREMVTRFMETADSNTAAGLQGKLAEVNQRFEQLCLQQQEKESSLKKLLPQAEMFEHLSDKLQQFVENKSRMLASGNQPDQDIARFSQQIQEVSVEMEDQKENLDTLEHLVTELHSCGFALDLSQHQDRIQNLKKDFTELQKTVKEREKDASSCQEQLDEFRKLIRLFQKWLKETEGSIPPTETFLSTKELEKQIEHLKGLLDDWVSKGSLVEEINCKGTSLENLIMEITAPDSQAKSGSILPPVGSSVGSVNGYHTCKDLTEIQCDMSDVNLKYEKLGGLLQERQESLQAVLDRMDEVQKEANSVLQWLESKEEVLKTMDASLSPTRTETVKAQAESNKAFLAELEQNSPKIQKVKEALAGLLVTYPNSQEAKNWKEMQEELNSRWERATEVTVARQRQLEESASHLACFQAAESQLRPWLMEKELMMGVLGPLSIDPNMLNAQKQQVQFMLKEFEARRQQHEQLNEAAQGIVTGPGDVSAATSQVQKELQNINQKWVELTDKLNSRSSQIDQAIIKSTQYQELLQHLSEKVKAVGQRLSGQSAISTQPEAVKQQLEETSEIRSDLEQLDHEIKEAQALCDELSVLIGEQYLKDELKKRLETVALPLQGLEDLAADRMNRLQAALASTQQFQQMFDELRTWLDNKQSQQAKNCPISAKLEQLQSQLQENEEFQKSLNQHSGSYEVIVAEGESLLLSVPPGEEKRTLQNQLVELKSHWEELSKKTADRQSRLKDCMQKAQKYQWHVEDLVPWIEDCKAKMSELRITLDPVQLESSLLRSKAMLSEVEKRRSLLEILNSAADILINSSETDEDDIRDEKTGINQNMDAITEELQAKTGSLEEMTQRLKEFQESFKNIEKKVEGAKHQLEIFDALGSQACSNKNLEKLRAQQEVLQALEPQVDYLRNFTQGLVEDAPDGSDASQLLHQAEVTQQEFLEVKQRVNSGCMTMENKLEGIGQFHCRVREMFSQLADLDDELDGMGAIGRDTDSLQSQIEDVHLFLSKIQVLKLDIEASEAECRQMLEEEGTLDLLGLKRELEALNKQCGKLTERGKARQEQLELTLGRVEDFYRKLKGLNDATTAAEEGEALQWVVGTEVDVINQQLADFKMFQKEQVDPLQMKLQQVNGLGQGLIQSAGKNCDVQGLEHDMEEINARWNTLNKKVAQRIAQLQEALLHCGKFQDALEPLLSWLADTEELIANQKPPSAEYKVVKAQIQEQKLLQRLLDDRKATVDMLQAEGGRIAQSAEQADREKITGQLESLESRWTELLSKAAARQKQLEDILVLAKQFHETAEPISDFLSVTEKKLANSEPVGTQTAKIQQQIIRHKALEEDVENHATDVHQAVRTGQSLSSLTCPAEQGLLSEKLDSLQARYSEIQDRCCRKAALLEQALSNARLFGEDEVEVLNWLAEVEDKLSSVFVKDYRQDVLQKQHADHLALNEEIVNRKKNVDQAIKNGQALLKQTTGEEVLLIQEKLDGIKTRYADITVTSSKALRTLEQARQLATKFQSTYEELTGWLRAVEDELAASGGQSPTGEQIPQFQQRQKELKKEVMEHRLVLDTVNEVSRALLELVPWRAREGLDKLVSDANEQYKLVSDTIGQRVDEIDAAIQRSQQYEQAADAELAWVAETKRKLMALGPIRLEQDQTTAQLQVQKAFSIDIIRHKDSMDELFSHRGEIFGTCGEEQKAVLQEKTESLIQQYEAISLLNSERYARLERAQVLVNQFWETYEELSPWIEETRALIAQLPPPAIDHEQLRQQQEEMRQLRESIAEHKPHIDKLLKIGPQLKELNPEEGEMVEEKYQKAENMYAQIKEEVRQRALALDEAISQSAQFHDKIEPMLETLENLSSRLRMPPLIPAEVDKIRECISDNKSATVELEKLQPSFDALKHRGEELIGRSQGADKDLAAKEIQDKLDQMVFFWEDIKARAEEREIKFLDVLELAEKFWYDMAALLATMRDTQDIIHDLESPGIDPSIIKQQVEAAETIKEETDGLHEELEFIRILGADLIFACGETEKPEVKKSIDEMNNAWENLNKTWKERLEKLEDAMQAAVQYQDTLQAMFDWLDNTVIKLCTMPPVGTDLNTVKDQLNEMKEFKVEVYQQQIEMEKLNHQGELMLKKATDETDRDIIREPLTELKHLWENLCEKIAHRQHKLEGALLALGQFQHALEELMSWLIHTEELLDAQRPISGDPKVIEVELAKHHVLKNDVLAHQATVETVNKAGNELLESSAGDDASSLRSRLETMNQCWESVLQKTEEREQQLQSTLQQAQGFHSEIEDFLLELTRMESQLSASKPTGGLPETAREQLDTHMELYSQLKAKEETYNQLLDKGRLMLLSRGDSGSGSKTEQSVALLEQKWRVVSSKMEERKSKLEEALNLATEFQNSLQEFINWLTLAEQSLNIASPPSLILNTVLSQIEEHKVFANEVNAHRDQIIELDQTGNQLKFLSQKQDVVLIKNLLVSVQSRWEKVVQRSIERGRSLDDARKRAKQFHEAWKKLIDWLEDAESHLDSELEISNDPDKIKLQLSKHKEFQKTLGGKQPVYDTTIRTGRALKEKTLLPDDTQTLDNLLGEVRDKWDTVCGKSVERQHKLEEALLFSGQFMDALQALVDWLYKVEPQLAEDQPVHGDLDLVMNLMDAHKVFQKELGKRTGTVQVLKRSGRELIENSRDDTTWVKGQLQELSTRWDTVCKLSVSKQSRLEQALKQAEEFRDTVHMLLEWLSEAEQTLRFRGALPDDTEALQSLIDTHKEFMKKVEEKRVDVNAAVAMGEVILAVCHPDCITTIKHWITIIRARFEEVLTWAKQHQQRLEAALSELVANAELLEELLAWIQWAETTLIQRDQEPIPQNIDRVKALIAEHQTFMEEMTRKQPDVDRVTKTYKRKTVEPAHAPFVEKSRSGSRKSLSQPTPPPMPILSQSEAKNPRINQLSARWQQVWLLALERQRKLNDALDRLEELCPEVSVLCCLLLFL